jgi:hypothetical protein
MLATSMHAQPGVYAVLIGSGVSTGARIPTGWGIVQKLVRQLATATAAALGQGDQLDETFDPERWWTDHHDKKLGYSSLLEAFPGTAATRQGLVARFIEPTEHERHEGRKTPSKAHVALAKLVNHGYVKVVVTTNFDRLIEHALEAAGVSPQVIARPEACSGMNPLTHDRATVIKLNGDYKDLESLNTSEELSRYPEEWNTLLKQILDEYGLLISGWSADWDKALVALIEASPNRRYPLYWDSRSSSGEEAQRLLRLRGGQVVQAETADELFEGLLASVEALEKLSEPPLTTAMAVSQLKRYLPDPVRHIDLYDLVMGYTQRAVEMISSQPVFIEEVSFGEDADDILHQDLVGTMPLAQLVATGVWHDTTGSHDQLWPEVLQELANVPPLIGTNFQRTIVELRRYPALLVLTAAGIAAVARARESLLLRLLTQVEVRDPVQPNRMNLVVHDLRVARILNDGLLRMMPRSQGRGPVYFPGSHLLKADARDVMRDLIPNDANYAEAFHNFEYRVGLVQHKMGTPPDRGEFILDDQWTGQFDDRRPATEVAFLKARGRVAGWPWDDFIGGDFEATVSQYRQSLRGDGRFG